MAEYLKKCGTPRAGIPTPGVTLTLALTLPIVSLVAGCSNSQQANSFLKNLGTNQVAQNADSEKPKQSLQDATNEWGKAFAKDPKNAETAINYAANLKAAGNKVKAFNVLAHSFNANPTHAGLTSAYGRAALSVGKIQLADKLLQRALSTGTPDWQTLSAKGTVLAKQGRYAKAQDFFQRALVLAPDEPSIMNNLALAYALDGRAKESEVLLRRAVKTNGDNSKLRQNLALVLGLQGRFDEAKKLAENDLSSETVKQNVAFLRKMVRPGIQTKAVTAPKVAPAPKATRAPKIAAPQVKPIPKPSSAPSKKVEKPSKIVIKTEPTVTEKGELKVAKKKVTVAEPTKSLDKVGSIKAPKDLLIPTRKPTPPSASTPVVSKAVVKTETPKKSGSLFDFITVTRKAITPSKASADKKKKDPVSLEKAKATPPPVVPATIRNGTYDDSLIGWIREVEKQPKKK